MLISEVKWLNTESRCWLVRGWAAGRAGPSRRWCQVALCPRDHAGRSRGVALGTRAATDPRSGLPASYRREWSAGGAAPGVRGTVGLPPHPTVGHRPRAPPLTDHARPPGRDATRLTAICNECANGVNVPLCPPVSASIRVTLQSYHLRRILRLIRCNLQIYQCNDRLCCIGPNRSRGGSAAEGRACLASRSVAALPNAARTA